MQNINRQIFHDNKYSNYKALASDESFFSDRVYLYKIFRQIHHLPADFLNSAKILEIGCADGSYLIKFKGQKRKLYGLEISEKAAEKAKRLGLSVERGDVESGVAYGDNYFDIVIATELIEHLYDTDFFIKEIYRIVKNGGYIFLSTPNLASLKNRLRLLAGKIPQYSEYRLGDKMAGHIRNYTVPALSSQLIGHGWSIESIVSPNIWFPMCKPLPLFTKKMAMWLGNYLPTIGSHIIIKARKK